MRGLEERSLQIVDAQNFVAAFGFAGWNVKAIESGIITALESLTFATDSREQLAEISNAIALLQKCLFDGMARRERDLDRRSQHLAYAISGKLTLSDEITDPIGLIEDAVKICSERCRENH